MSEQNKDFETIETFEGDIIDLDTIEEDSDEFTSTDGLLIAGLVTGVAAAGAGVYALATKVVIPGAKQIAADIKEAAEDKKNLTKEEREEKKLRRKMEKLVIKVNRKKLAEIEQQYAEEAEAAQQRLIDELIDEQLNPQTTEDSEEE